MPTLPAQKLRDDLLPPAPAIGTSILDELLHFACEALQLTPTLHAEADGHYRAVANWIGAEDSYFFGFDPDIYPQGSFRIGTTTRPILDNEFDLDFVLQLLDRGVKPLVLLEELEKRLRANKMYAPMVERLNRCVRLNYANQFHLDILPGVLDGTGTRIAVPDRKVAGWKSSDPKAHAAWFLSRGLTERFDKAAQIAPLPSIQTAAEKSVLQRAVQLFKRARDRFFQANCEIAPRSIVLTTIAAWSYSGTRSTVTAIYEAVHKMRALVASSERPIEVWNPVNPLELLSEHWNTNPIAYQVFRRWLDAFADDWDKLLAAKSIPEMQQHLASLFGDGIATDAIVKHAARIDDLRKGGSLKISTAGGLMTGSGAAAVVRPNTFYGDHD